MIENFVWLTLCIYFEARGEPFDGQVAVAHVVLNRVERRDASIKDIVKAPYQFSWLNPEAKRPTVTDLDALVTSAHAALFCLQERMDGKDFFGADHYFADYIRRPTWAEEMKFLRQIGQHLFFKS